MTKAYCGLPTAEHGQRRVRNENQESAVCSFDDLLQMTQLWLHAALRRLDSNPQIISRTDPGRRTAESELTDACSSEL